MLLSERRSWGPARILGDHRALLVSIDRTDTRVLLALGNQDRALDLIRAQARDSEAPPVGWMSLPRRVRVPSSLLAGLGLTAVSTWDWLASDIRPPRVTGEDDVERLTPADVPQISACLEAANPRSSADPAAFDDVSWWGVRGAATDGSRPLVGVISAAARSGDPERADRSCHLRGLSVRPSARGQGWGSALTAAAVRENLTEGADWVSLGMYASNSVARRLYRRLGFVTVAQRASFGPSGAAHPPT